MASAVILAPLPSIQSIMAGIPTDALAEFSELSGLPVGAICEVVIPLRTLKHRRSRHEALSRDESDKLTRLIRVFNHTVEVFGDLEIARGWFTDPLDQLDHQSPIEMLKTEAGARLVDGLLWQISDGMFA